MKITCLALSILFIIYGTLIPFHFTHEMDTVYQNISKINWTPLWDVSRGRIWSIPDMVQNVLLFLPLGVFGFLTFRRLALVIFLGAGLSLTCEILQLFTIDRLTGLTDVTTNTIGAALGAALAKFGPNLISSMEASGKLEALKKSQPLRSLTLITLLIIVYFFEPFDFTLDVGTVVPKIRSFIHDPLIFTPIRQEPFNAFVFTFWGFYFWEAGKEFALGQRLFRIALPFFALIFSFGIEALQFIVASRMPQVQDALANLAGLLFGSCIWKYKGAIPEKLRLPLFVLASTIALVVLELSPFQFAPAPTTINLLPFEPYYLKTDFMSFSDSIVMVEMGLLLSWGILAISVTSTSAKRTFWISVTYFTCLLGILEFCQEWVVERYPDITDILLVLLGMFAINLASIKNMLFSKTT